MRGASTAHQLQGGPMAGVVVVIPKGKDYYPAELRLTPEKDQAPDAITIHVYRVSHSHASAPSRPERPTYHYSHTKTI